MATQQLSRQSSARAEVSRTLIRWLWIWITLGILVVVTVIGFLIGIVRALESIDTGLATATNAVQGIGGDADPLPGYIQEINSNLTQIDTALKPIPGQAGEIGSGLETITNSLQGIDASLKDTSASLVDTSGSLVDTSGVLVNASNSVATISGSLVDTTNILTEVLDRAATIDGVLIESQRPQSLGTAGIFPRVAVANSILVPAQGDTSNIVGQLVQTNQHLTGICTSLPLTVLGVATAQPNC